MVRRSLACLALTLAALVVFAPRAPARTVSDPIGTSTTVTAESDLPGTTLEAQERDDGSTPAAQWLIGSGIAAVVAIGVGGSILKRRAD